MDHSKFPVTLEYFKKMTKNYDMYINYICERLRLQDPKLYNRKSENIEERNKWAFRKYYEMFYTSRCVRKECPLQLKSMPKHVRDKILEFPRRDKRNKKSKPADVEEPEEEARAGEETEPAKEVKPMEEAKSAEDAEPTAEVKHAEKAKQAEKAESAELVNLANMECPAGSNQIGVVNPAVVVNIAKVANQDEVVNPVDSGEEPPPKKSKLCKNTEDIANQTVSQEDQATPLELPVSFEEFKKFTYYDEIVDKVIKKKYEQNVELCQKILKDRKNRESALKYYYRAFYLQPGIRNTCPVRLKALPKKLRERVLKIPLSEVENNAPNARKTLTFEGAIQPISSEMSNPSEVDMSAEVPNPPVVVNLTKVINPAETVNPTTNTDAEHLMEDQSEDDIQLEAVTPPISSEMSNPSEVAMSAEVSNPTAVVNPAKVVNPAAMVKPTANADAEQLLEDQIEDDIQPISTPEKCKTSQKTQHPVDSTVCQGDQELQIPTTTKNSQLSALVLPKLPVLYEEFLKYTYYEEFLNQVIITKYVQDYDLCEQILNDRKKRESALKYYYYMFYLKPKIRKLYPIQLKPMPKKLRGHVLQIPPAPEDGCNVENIQKSFMCEDLFEDMIDNGDDHDENDDNAPYDEQIIQNIKELQSMDKIANETNDFHKLHVENPTKSTNPESVFDVPLDEIKIYRNNCPINYKDFQKFTNIKEILKEYHGNEYGGEVPLKVIIHYWLIFYCKPEFRKLNPLNRLKVKPNYTEKIKRIVLRLASHLENEDSKVDESKKENTNPAGMENVAANDNGEGNKGIFVPSTLKNNTNNVQILEHVILVGPTIHPTNVAKDIPKENSAEIPTVNLQEIPAKNPTEILAEMPLETVNAIPAKMPLEALTEIPTEVTNSSSRKINTFNIAETQTEIPAKTQTEIPAKTQTEVQTEIPPKIPMEISTEIPAQPSMSSSSRVCSNNKCITNIISFKEFLEHTNILEILSKSPSKNDLQMVYLNVLHNLIEQKTVYDDLCYKNYIFLKIIKGVEKCNDCAKYLAEKEPAERDNESSHNVNSTLPLTTAVENTNGSANNKNSQEKQLKGETSFKKICLKIIQKSSEPFDCTTFALTFEQFKDHYKIPLKTIFNELCNGNEYFTKLLLKDKEMRCKLLRYCYIKYNTIQNFQIKYPLKFKRIQIIEYEETNQNATTLSRTISTNNQLKNVNKLQQEVSASSSSSKSQPLQNAGTSKSQSVEASATTLTKTTMSTNNQLKNVNKLQQEVSASSTSQALQNIRTSESQNVQASVGTFSKLLQNKRQVNAKTTTSTPDIPTKSSNRYIEDLEKAKRIIFRNTDKIHSLPYLLRTTFGLKQNIIRALLSMSYEEFFTITYIFEGNSLYSDSQVIECIYKRIFTSDQAWPLILYITLNDLCDFFKTKYIIIPNYPRMLEHISPKFLHWSNLRICSNFDECVLVDYNKRTGKRLNKSDETLFAGECSDYYNRCWKYEKWIGQTPLLHEEFVQELLKDGNRNDNVELMDDTSSLREIHIEGEIENANESLQPSELVVCDYTHNNEPPPPVTETQQTTETERLLENDLSGSNTIGVDQNFVILPNTQQQIAMLPNEIIVPDDPLQHVSTSFNDSAAAQPVCVAPIKTEPGENKLLNNLKFMENDNSEILCTECEDSVIDLDETINGLDLELLPSQIDLDRSRSPIATANDVLPHSGNSDGSDQLNLAQRLPSSAESNETPPQSHNLLLPQQQSQHNMLRLTPNDCSSRINENFRTQEDIDQQLEESLIELIGDNDLNNDDVDVDMSTIIGNQNVENLKNSQNVLKTLPSLLDFHDNDLTVRHLDTISPTPPPPASSQPPPQNVTTTFMEAQRFPSTFEESQKSSDSNDQQHNIFIGSQFVTIRRAKSTKLQVATIKPVQKSSSSAADHNVPQRKHHIRPLPAVATQPPPLTLISSRTTVREQQNRLPIMSTKAIQHSSSKRLAATSSHVTEQTKQNLLPNLSTVIVPNPLFPSPSHIHVSQELSTNCTVFNNSSLLRIVDINYQRQSQSPQSSTASPTAHQQTRRQSPRNSGQSTTSPQRTAEIRSPRQISTLQSSSTSASPTAQQKTRRLSPRNSGQSTTSPKRTAESRSPRQISTLKSPSTGIQTSSRSPRPISTLPSSATTTLQVPSTRIQTRRRSTQEISSSIATRTTTLQTNPGRSRSPRPISTLPSSSAATTLQVPSTRIQTRRRSTQEISSSIATRTTTLQTNPAPSTRLSHRSTSESNDTTPKNFRVRVKKN